MSNCLYTILLSSFIAQVQQLWRHYPTVQQHFTPSFIALGWPYADPALLYSSISHWAGPLPKASLLLKTLPYCTAAFPPEQFDCPRPAFSSISHWAVWLPAATLLLSMTLPYCTVAFLTEQFPCPRPTSCCWIICDVIVGVVSLSLPLGLGDCNIFRVVYHCPYHTWQWERHSSYNDVITYFCAYFWQSWELPRSRYTKESRGSLTLFK